MRKISFKNSLISYLSEAGDKKEKVETKLELTVYEDQKEAL